MDTNNYDGFIEQWKADLIASRARRMGFRPDEISDVQQQIIFDVAAFRFDATKSKAKEATALVGLIDNKLKQMCRTMKRYRLRLDRLREEPIPNPDFEDTQKLLASATPWRRFPSGSAWSVRRLVKAARSGKSPRLCIAAGTPLTA